MKKLYILLVAVLIMVVTGCASSSSDAPLSSAKAITAFNISFPVLATGVITENTIAVTVPNGTPVTALVATFTTTGVSVTVDSTPQRSGSTTNNFSSGSLTYTVTAADGSTQPYTVTVTISSSLSGFLDTGFGTAGTGGIVTTPIGNIDYKSLALGIQSDKKIVVAGSSYNGSKYNFTLLRYNTNGTLDTSGTPGTGFGTTGIVTTSIGSTDDEAFALGIQSDGSIVVAGSSLNGSYYKFALAKYKPDGSLDTSFGIAHSGKVTTPIGSSNDLAYALGIQSDDSIVVAGFSYDGTSKYNFALVKYTKDGILDTTFGTAHTGIVTKPIGSYYDYAYALCVQLNDSIVIAGRSATNNVSTTYEFALVKYTKDGILDTTFGTGGITTTPIGSTTAEAHALGVQSDGSIVVAGSFYNDSSSKYDFALVKYTKDGILDTTFGTNGVVTKSIGSNYDFAYALGIQKSDDSIVAAGFSNNGSNYDFALVKYTKDGILNTTFGTGGITTTPIGSSDDYAFALGIQKFDGKIVVAGTFYNLGSSKYDFALARYWP